MYQYTEVDKKMVQERVHQFRNQVERRLDGRLTEDEFRTLRLMNGLYMQRHAYMLRVAIPYGLLSSQQLRVLGDIAHKYDRDFGHFTTRQNIQYNWLELEQVPDILQDLSDVEMHAIQTSGNCIRNVTTDHLAGVAQDEIEDPRPYCEILRQYSTFHPEFSFLPRKFKIAFNGAENDRAAVAFHDIGFELVRNDQGEVGFKVIVGGGQGRTPIIGKSICDFLEKKHLLSYTEAIMRVYNLHGNRQNKYKARIKILLRDLGVEEFRRQVDEEWARMKDGAMLLTDEEIERVKAFFPTMAYDKSTDLQAAHEEKLKENRSFRMWFEHNTTPHQEDNYQIVYISLKGPGVPPGDMTSKQMHAVADLADTYSMGEIRTTHDQNLVLAEVRKDQLFALWQELDKLELAFPNIGTVTDMICCPGLDFCSLANATSIPIADEIGKRFDELDELYDIGEVKLKMSGCINACGHHHVGHIGILGIDKRGEEFYQIMLGGSAENDASLGKWIGPALAKDQIVGALEKLVKAYVDVREGDERFLDTYRRVGVEPFKESVYGPAN